MSKKRIDIYLVEQGFAESRARAKSLISEGKVLINKEKILKSSYLLNPENTKVELLEDFPYVSRGALKLEKALDYFAINVQDRIAIDIGSSTGGFTDLLLQRGVKKVYCVDVGTNQLAYKLRMNPKVIVMEQTNARFLEANMFEQLPDIAVIDVSFISLSLILPVVKKINPLETIALIKPQFEIGKELTHFDGVVKKEADRIMAIEKVKKYAVANLFLVIDIIESPIKGPKGNIEYLLYLK